MALVSADLASSLASVFASMPASPAAAAEALAGAYFDYAKLGNFGGGIPLLPALEAKRDALKTTLEAAIGNPLVGLPATFAAAWASGVATFWTGVTVAGATSGTTNGCPGASSLTGSLSAVFANLLNTPTTCAAGMALALDTATKTTTATVTPPIPAAPVPIT